MYCHDNHLQGPTWQTLCSLLTASTNSSSSDAALLCQTSLLSSLIIDPLLTEARVLITVPKSGLLNLLRDACNFGNICSACRQNEIQQTH
jgi:hypothetical protein